MISYLYYIHYHLAVISKPAGLPETELTQSVVQKVLQVIFILLGSLAVLMVTIGGFMYVTSQGEARQVKSAKDTILYAVIGLFVALGSWAMVTFVLDGIFN